MTILMYFLIYLAVMSAIIIFGLFKRECELRTAFIAMFWPITLVFITLFLIVYHKTEFYSLLLKAKIEEEGNKNDPS